MSYLSIHKCANDGLFNARVTSCIVQEQIAKNEAVNPWQMIESMKWAVASASDVEAAYESALANNNLEPGGDEAVITDGMILSHVQANWSAEILVGTP